MPEITVVCATGPRQVVELRHTCPEGTTALHVLQALAQSVGLDAAALQAARAFRRACWGCRWRWGGWRRRLKWFWGNNSSPVHGPPRKVVVRPILVTRRLVGFENGLLSRGRARVW